MKYMELAAKKFWFVFLFCLLSTLPANAVDRVDTDFGNNGFVVHDFGTGDDEIFALVTQADGRYVVAGYSDNGAVANVVVARYLAGGNLDNTFNHDGIFSMSLGSGDSIARAVALEDDGRMVLACSSFDTQPRLVVVVLTKDGYPDGSFGDNGRVVFPLEGEKIVAADLKIAADGTIVATATVALDDSAREIVLVKMDNHGQMVEDFGNNGVVSWEYGDKTEMRSLVLFDSGKILLAGSVEKDGLTHAGLLRRNKNGAPDSAFGTAGEFLLGLDGDGAVINDIYLETGDNVLMAGAVGSKEHRRAFLARLKADDIVDPDFGGEKGFFLSTSDDNTAAFGVAKQDDGTIVLAGYTLFSDGQDMAVWTLAGQNGKAQSLTKFHVNQVVTDVDHRDDGGYALALLPSSKVLVAGFAENGTDKDFVLVRYEDSATVDNPVVVGVITGNYRVTTMPVTEITRVGAMSGGVVEEFRHDVCENKCRVQCSLSTGPSNTTCYDTCLKSCQGSTTVKTRGVCYNISGGPIYKEKSTGKGTDNSGATDSGTLDDKKETIFPKDSYDRSYIYKTVRSGQTEDGAGFGSFTSEITEITPNVTYYLRAFAVMADGTVIYGNEETFKTDDACFIATAAFGTILDKHVVLLRRFRDKYLMPSTVGRSCVAMYYHYSPPLADLISENAWLRGIVRVVLYPVVLAVAVLMKTTTQIKIFGIFCTLLFVGVCSRLRRMRRV